MVIRGVMEADLEAVTKLENKCFPSAEAASKDALAYRIKTFPTSFFVAMEDKEMIGFINGGITNNRVISDALFAPDGGHNPLGENQAVFGLVVDPNHQRKGIARELLDYFIKMAKEDGRKRVILTCKDVLIAYYESFGFVNRGVSKSTHGDAVWYDLEITL